MIPRFRPDLGFAEIYAAVRQSASVEAFERAFALQFGCAEAVAFGYGRMALSALLQTQGVSGMEVVIPAYTCSVVAHAITLSGNTPHFVDAAPDTLNMRLDQMAEAISDRTGAVVATHLFGRSLDLDVFDGIIVEAERRLGRKLLVVQDCAHSFGATWRGRMGASSRDAALFGLNISKLMTSIFGGMITTNDVGLASRLRGWRNQHVTEPRAFVPFKRLLYLCAATVAFSRLGYGAVHWLQTSTPWLKGMTDAYHLDEQVAFPPDAGEGMTKVAAAVGLMQLQKYPGLIERRRASAVRYLEALPALEPDWRLPPPDPESTWSHFTARVPDRREARSRWLRRGIELGELIQYSVAHLPAYRDCPGAARCTESLRASQDTVNLPLPDAAIP